MRKLSFFLTFALVLSLAYGAVAQTHNGIVKLDAVTHTFLDLGVEKLVAGQTHVASIRYNFLASSNLGRWQGSNAIEVYSPEGANWGNLQETDGPLLGTIAGVSKFKKYYTSTNAGASFASTGGGGTALPGGGGGVVGNRVAFSLATVDLVNNGFEGGVANGIAFDLTFSSLVADAGKHICCRVVGLGLYLGQPRAELCAARARPQR